MSNIILTVLFASLAVFAMSDECTRLSSNPSIALGTSCSGAVDYDFFLPTGVTLDFLNLKATQALNNSGFSILPTECQKSLKNMICSNIYLKCPENIVVGNPQTYNLDIYYDIAAELVALKQNYSSVPVTLPLPFQRPCVSVCGDVLTKCNSFLVMLGSIPDCGETVDYSKGALSNVYSLKPTLSKPFKYDLKNNPLVCNAPNTGYAVQATKEPYIHANNPNGFCYGIVKELFVPPANAMSSTLAPMQPPFVVQNMIEQQLQTGAAKLPVYLSRECKIAIKKYMCGSAMFAPSAQSFGRAMREGGYGPLADMLPPSFTEHTFYMPSHPHQSICQEYAQACGQFIAMANAAPLTPVCNAVRNGVSSYPLTNQTLMSKDIPMGAASVSLQFKTPPNYMSSATFETDFYNTKCPDGFVIPNRDDPRTSWIPGSGCAISCLLPIFTIEEWDSFILQGIIVAYIGLAMITFFVVTWLTDKERRKQYLVVIFAGFSFLVSILTVVISTLPFEKNHCIGNAVKMDETDGVTMCAVQAYITVFGVLGTACTWMLLSIDVFLKIVMGYRSTQQFKVAFITIAVTVPLIFMIAGSQLHYGFLGVMPVCSVINPDDMAVIMGPLTVFAGIGFLCMLAVVFKILRSIAASATSDSTSAWEKFNMVRTPIIFVALYLSVILSLLSMRYSLETKGIVYQESLGEFVMCTFKNYDGSNSYKRVCGEHPKERLQEGFPQWLWFGYIGQSIIVSLIYLSSPSVWKLWYKRFSRATGRLGLESTLNMMTTKHGKYNENVSRIGGASTVIMPVKEKCLSSHHGPDVVDSNTSKPIVQSESSANFEGERKTKPSNPTF